LRAKFYREGRHDPENPFAVADAMQAAGKAGLTDEQISEAMDAGLADAERSKAAEASARSRHQITTEEGKRGAHRYVAAKSRLRKKLGREPTTGEMGKDLYRRMMKRSAK
jgi:hypothetical protein